MKKALLLLLATAFNLSVFGQFPVKVVENGFPVSVSGVTENSLDSALRVKIRNANKKRLGGWSLGATNVGMLNSAQITTNGAGNFTDKIRHWKTADGTEFRLVYSNWTLIYSASSVQNNPSEVTVAASFQYPGIASIAADDNAIIPVSFNGRRRGKIDPASLLYSDPVYFHPDSIFFTRTFNQVSLATAPPDPTINVLNTGGALVASSTYYVSTLYVMADGGLSLASNSATATTSTGGNTYSIVVTSPAAIAGAVGWTAYMSARNDNSGIISKASEINAFGSDITLTYEVSQNSRFLYRNGQVVRTFGTIGSAGGVTQEGMSDGSGYKEGDQTGQGSLAISPAARTSGFSPAAIQVRTDNPLPTWAIVGDSRQAGTGDHGSLYNNGGPATRAVLGQFELCFNPNTKPKYAYVRVPLGGETAQRWSQIGKNNRYNVTQKLLTKLATNVLCNFGINELSLGLATLKASTLENAAEYAKEGIKFFQFTLPPKVNTTDGYRTIGNMTSQGGSQETVRIQFNDWLRDTSATGFIRQANMPGLVDVIDICKYSEVNSSNVLTQNGGLLRVPVPGDGVYPSGFTPFTGTITTGGTSEFRDNSKTWTRNQWKGYNVVMTSGAQAGKAGTILYNTTDGTFNISSSIGGTVSPGDTYIITLIPSVDGTHFSSYLDIWHARAVEEKLPEGI